MTAVSPVSPPTALPPDKVSRLREAAQEMEASFLSEMLKAAKFGEPRKAFGGGIGEEQFASFFRGEISKKMAAAGGIGLSEQIFQALIARESDAG